MSECKPGAGSQGGGLLWFLGVIGAAIWFIGQSEGFWGGVLGFLKALVWPVFLVWKLLEHLNA